MKTFFGLLIVLLASVTIADAQWAQCGGYNGGDVRAFAVNGTTLFAATATSGVLRSVDNGLTWSFVGQDMSNKAITSFVTNSSGLYLGCNTGIYRSTDNGESWTACNTGLSQKNVLTLAVKGSLLFAGTAHGGVFRSTDNGASWAPVNAGLNAKFVNTLTVNDGILFAGGTGIYRSSDDGESWVEVNKGFPTRTYIAFAAHGRMLFAATEGVGIYRSMDNGTTWTEANTGLSNLTMMSLLVRGNTLFAATFDGVYVSANDGDTWVNVHLGIGSNYIGSMISTGQRVFASTTGKGIWKLDVEALGMQENTTGELSGTNHIYCYPNPATKLLTIDCTSLSFSTTMPVKYTFTTLSGAKFTEFEQSQQHFTVSLEGLAAGVYYLTAEQGSHIASVMVTVVE